MALTKIRGNGIGTLGDGTANDTKIVFDGNAQDFHIGLDDSSDSLTIGLGSALGTTSHIVVDASGRVTMPLQVSFMQKEQPNVSASNIVKGGVSDHNIGSHLNTTTGVFTAPIAGKYLFTAGILTNASNARMEMFVRKNSSNYIAGNEVTGSGSNYGSPTISVIYQLAANDTADLYLSSGTMYSGHPSNYFSGCLLG